MVDDWAGMAMTGISTRRWSLIVSSHTCIELLILVYGLTIDNCNTSQFVIVLRSASLKSSQVSLFEVVSTIFLHSPESQVLLTAPARDP